MSYYSDIEYKQKNQENSWFERYYFDRWFKDVPAPILDIGCATGNFLALDPQRLEGIDIDDDSLKIAAERGLKARKLDCANLSELPSDYYSGVYVKHVIEHLVDPLDFIKEIKRILKPGGRVIISTPNCPYMLKKNFFDDYTHKQAFTKASLKMIAYDAGFRQIKIYEDFRCLPGLGRLIRAFDLNPEKISRAQRFLGIRGLSLVMELTKEKTNTNTMKKALITGITGQDGSYLAEILLAKGYEVHGLVRRTSTFNRHNIDHIFNSDDKRQAFLHYGDMTDFSSIFSIISRIQPDEIYNLAAQSHVRVSFEIPFYTAQSDAIGVLNILEAVHMLKLSAKIYQASTSELYSGKPEEAPQNEKTPFKPKSPYGVAKLYGFEIARVYRESYGMFVCNGILFNHESPRRGENFVTRKIVLGVKDIQEGRADKIYLGNLDAKRDWGYSPEYMEAAWLMLQREKPEDFVIATGETHSVREFVEECFRLIGREIEWQGQGVEEKGLDKNTKQVLIELNPEYFRPNEVDHLLGDATKARTVLGWQPKITFKELVKIMMEADKVAIK